MPMIRLSNAIMWKSDFCTLLEKRRLHGTAVEIGAGRGVDAQNLLSGWGGEQYVGVDPWERVAEMAPEYDGPLMTEQDRCCCQTHLYSQYGPRVRLYQGTSLMAAERRGELYPEFVDFVYLDGDRSVGAVRQDLAMWWERLSSRGILAGAGFSSSFPGVMQAVSDFADHVELIVYTTHEQFVPSWYLRKEAAAAEKAVIRLPAKRDDNVEFPVTALKPIYPTDYWRKPTYPYQVVAG